MAARTAGRHVTDEDTKGQACSWVGGARKRLGHTGAVLDESGARLHVPAARKSEVGLRIAAVALLSTLEVAVFPFSVRRTREDCHVARAGSFSETKCSKLSDAACSDVGEIAEELTLTKHKMKQKYLLTVLGINCIS